MMGESDIPDDIKQLIVEKIPSVAHLEAVLLLRAHPSEGWTAEVVARRLYISPAEATSVLADLREQGFARVEGENPAGYRYSPRSTRLADLVDGLAETYRLRLIAVTNLIHSLKPNRNVRRFSDAFRIRRDG